jgi:hypothetical protein
MQILDKYLTKREGARKINIQGLTTKVIQFRISPDSVLNRQTLSGHGSSISNREPRLTIAPALEICIKGREYCVQEAGYNP